MKPFYRWITGVLAIIACIVSFPAVGNEALPKVHEPGAILKIVHGWPSSDSEQDKLIQYLVRQGFSGAVCNVSFQDYLESEAAWQSFQRAVDRAHDSGMTLWLYDESGYPSATAGHLVLTNHPEWEAEGLLSTWALASNSPVKLTLPPGTPFLVAAYPWDGEKLNLDGMTNLAPQIRDGSIEWKPVSGQWMLMGVTRSHLYAGTHAEMNLAEKRPYPNLLMREPTARFIEVTHDRYAKHLGGKLSKTFVSTFTDEPSLMSVFIKQMPYRPLPWSPDFSDQFKTRRGYALEPLLPLLLLDGGAKTSKTRYDFWNTVGELVTENYTGQLRDWCQKHGIYSGGHLLMEEGITAQVGLYGNFFSCLRCLSAPGIDCLTSIPAEVPWYIARQASSAADLNGGGPVMCETSDFSQVYRPEGDKRPRHVVSEAEVRGTCNKLMAAGISTITSYYSFDKLDEAAMNRINRSVAAVATRMAGGVQSADVAMLFPVESLWTRFVPSRQWANEAGEAQAVETCYHAASQQLYDSSIDFTVIDSTALLAARADKDALRHGALAWRVVVLPRVDTLPAAAWKKLSQWVDAGGVVVALGTLPQNSETEFPSSEVQAMCDKMFFTSGKELLRTNANGGAGVYLPKGMEWLLPDIVTAFVEPDVQISPVKSPIRVTHRRVEGRERYFLINDSAEPWTGAVSFRGMGTGSVLNVCADTTNAVNGKSASLKLGTYEGAVFDFSEASPTIRKPLTVMKAPRLKEVMIQSVIPTVGRGEFVRETFGVDSAHFSSGLKAWNANARIIKGGVDVHLFAGFHYEQTVDLSGADAVVFDTWVPTGQRTASQILVIVHERDGGDFVASTGRSLSTSGKEKLIVPLAAFTLAGWSKDADGRMDWSKVSDIRIGWGGYYGTEGESVEMSFTEPAMMQRCQP